MPSLGPLEMGIILVIVIIIFGAGKLPELGGSLGKTFRDFKNATREVDDLKQTISLDKEVGQIKQEVGNLKQSVSLNPMPTPAVRRPAPPAPSSAAPAPAAPAAPVASAAPPATPPAAPAEPSSSASAESPEKPAEG